MLGGVVLWRPVDAPALPDRPPVAAVSDGKQGGVTHLRYHVRR